MSNSEDIIVPKGKRLLDVIKDKRLPNGRIIKDSTGVGATTVELRAERHSIICEPLRSIIDSKKNSFKDKIEGKEGPQILAYYGEVEEIELRDYISSRPAFLKIMVTPERVGKLVDDLEKLGQNAYRDFFLLLDEVDLYQIQANLRKNISIATDHYRNFVNRAILTATPYTFSHPVLGREHQTKIIWEGKALRNITLVNTDNVVRSVIKHIDDSPGQKFIFINSIEAIIEIISKSGIDPNEVAAFCGANRVNQERLGSYYQEFTSKPTRRYNFYTSAYFSGCDLNCSGNVITVLDGNNEVLALTPGQIKQIGGRLRKGIEGSDIVIVKLSSYIPNQSMHDLEEWLHAQAERDINLGRHTDLKGLAGIKNVKSIMFNTQYFARKNQFGQIEKDYNLIDYELIKFDAVRRLYFSKNLLVAFFDDPGSYFLKEKIEEKFEKTPPIPKFNRARILEEVKKITFDCLMTAFKTPGDSQEIYVSLLRKAHRTASAKIRPFLEYLLEYEGKSSGWPMVDEVILSSKGSQASLISYLSRLKFKELPAHDAKKAHIEKYFKIGQQYSNQEILRGMREIAPRWLTETVTTTNRAIIALKMYYEIGLVNSPRMAGEQRRGKEYKIYGYVIDHKTGEYV